MSDKKYAVVTCISQYRIRYVIPMDELQAENPDAIATVDWAKDSVTLQEVKEFSQEWLGETIIDAEIESEDDILARFDKENDYLSGWEPNYKLAYIRKWKEVKDD